MAHRPRWIKSVDHFREVNVSVGGAAEKSVIEDPDSGAKFIAKLGGRNNDLEVATEYAIFLVSKLVKVRVAEGTIAWYKGKLRYLSRYFLDEQNREQLVHGIELFRLLDLISPEDLIGRGNEEREQRLFTVQAVKAVFGAHYLSAEDELFADLVAVLTHDALIGVQDRHHENWGIVTHREAGGLKPRIAPIYDSARGLYCNHTDEHLKPKLREADSS